MCPGSLSKSNYSEYCGGVAHSRRYGCGGTHTSGHHISWRCGTFQKLWVRWYPYFWSPYLQLPVGGSRILWRCGTFQTLWVRWYPYVWSPYLQFPVGGSRILWRCGTFQTLWVRWYPYVWSPYLLEVWHIPDVMGAVVPILLVTIISPTPCWWRQV